MHPPYSPRSLHRLLAPALALALAGTLTADTFTWDGGGSDNNWSTPENWAGDVAPTAGAGHTLVFDGTTRPGTINDLGGGASFFDLKLGSASAGSFTFGGDAIQLGDAGGGSTIFNGNVSGGQVTTFDADLWVNEGVASFTTFGTLVFNGELVEIGSANSDQLHNFNNGTFIFNDPASSFSRGVSANNNGTIITDDLKDGGVASKIGAGLFIKLGNAAVGGMFEYTGGATTTDRQIQVGGGANNAGYTGGGTILNNGTGAITFDNAQFNRVEAGTTAGRTLTLGGSHTGGTNVISGLITDNDQGALDIIIDGSNWRFGSANTYSGKTTINNGALLQLGADNALSETNTLEITDGTLDLGGFDQTLDTTGGDLTLGGVAGGTPRIDTGGGTLTITDDNVAAIKYLQTGNGNGAVIDGNLFWSNPLNKNMLFVVGDSTNAAVDLTVNAVIGSDQTGGTFFMQGGFVGAEDAGTMELTALNTFDANPEVRSGTLIIGNNDHADGSTPGALGIGNANLDIGNEALDADAAVLLRAGLEAKRTLYAQNDTNAAVTRTIGGADASGTALFSGAVNIAPLTTLGQVRLQALPGGTVEFSGQILDGSNTVGVEIVGGGTVVLSLPTGNAYDGPTVVAEGTLSVENSSGSATGTGDITVKSGATLTGNSTGRVSGDITVEAGGTLTGEAVYQGAVSMAGDLKPDGFLRVWGGLTLWNASESVFNILSTSTHDSLAGNGGTVTAENGASIVFDFTGYTDFIEGSGFLIFNNFASRTDNGASISTVGLPGGLTLNTDSLFVDGTVFLEGVGPVLQSTEGDLTYADGSSFGWDITANTQAQGDPAVFDQVTVGGNLDFSGETVFHVGADGEGSQVDWSDPFWSSSHSWLLYDVAGAVTGFDGVFVLQEDWQDGQGDALSSVHPRSYFKLRLEGSAVYLDYCMVSLPAGGALLHRSNGQLVSTLTGDVFRPVGFNFIRLNTLGAEHHTFAPEVIMDGGSVLVNAYDGPAATAMFQKLASAGFNTARVFINQTVSPVSISAGGTAAQGLDDGYMDNVVDFLQRARAEGCFVIFSLDWFPSTDYYREGITDPAPANVTGNNLFFFHPQYIEAKKLYHRDFINGIIERDPEALRAVLAINLCNELNYPVNEGPFNLSSGTVQAPNGTTYDIATDKELMADEMTTYWINELHAHIKTLVPWMITDSSVFTYYAVNRAIGDFDAKEADYKNRYPFNPMAMAVSDVDIVDIHLYNDSLAELDTNLDSVEWDAVRPVAEAAGKVLLVGEFGVNYTNFGENNFDVAKLHAPTFARAFFEMGFDGWLQWTYDCFEQNKHYPAVQNNFTIFNMLAQVLEGEGQVWYQDAFDGAGFGAEWTPATPSDWGVTGGAAVHTDAVGLDQIAQTQQSFSDFTITTRFKFDADTGGWGGINFRKSSATSAAWNDGYSLFIRPDGTLTLNVQATPADITLAGGVVTGLDPVADWVDLSVTAIGNRIQVWANGTLAIDVTDSTYDSGYASLTLYQQAGRFDEIRVTEELAGTFDGWAEFNALPVGRDAPDEDADDDGWPNAVEYACGTDPLDPASYPRPLLELDGAAALYHLPLNPRATGVTLGVEVSDDLSPGSWTTQPATGTLDQQWFRSTYWRTVRRSPLGDKLFLRITAEPN